MKEHYPDETVAIAVLHMHGVDNLSARTLIREHGSALSAVKTILGTAEEYLDRLREVLQEAAAAGFEYVPLINEPDIEPYAEQFPAGVFVSGSAPEMIIRRIVDSVAVTGTRDPSPYGREMAKRIAASLKDAGCPLVTGFALGIDEAAITSALDSHVSVLAVSAAGAGDVYPLQMKSLYERLMDEPDCSVVTPFFPHTAPAAMNFLKRNWLIALAGDVVVAEAKSRGGAMVIARLAKSFVRNVQAVPGRLTDERAAGCNQLIREGTAKIADIPR